MRLTIVLCEYLLDPKWWIAVVVLNLSILLVVICAAQESKMEAGLYVRQGEALTKLTPAQFTGVKGSGTFVKDFYWTFRGNASDVQLSNNHPQFVLYGARGIFPAERIVIVPVEPKKDYLELKIIHASMFGAHGGFDPEKTVTTTIKKRDDDTWDILLDKDLKPGEYIVTTEVKPSSGQRAVFNLGILRAQ